MIFKCTNANGLKLTFERDSLDDKLLAEVANFYRGRCAYHLPISIKGRDGSKAIISKEGGSEAVSRYPAIRRGRAKK